MFLLFVHMVSSLFVFIGVFAAEQGKSDETKTGNWITIMLCVIFGVLSLFYLIILGYLNKLRFQGITVTRMSNLSLNLWILFLWIFGCNNSGLNQLRLLYSMYDIFTFTDQSSIGLILSNIIIMLFLLIQTGFIIITETQPFYRWPLSISQAL